MIDFYSSDPLERGVLAAINDPTGAVSQLGPQAPRLNDALLQAQQQAPALSPAVSPDTLPPAIGSQTGLDAFIASPGLAMASQAANNIFALRRNQVPRVTPVMAAQQAMRQNQALNMRRARILDERERAANAQKLRDLQMQQVQRDLDQPSPIPNPYSAFPQDIQMWKLSGTDKPFDEWLQSAGSTSQPAYVQEFMFGENLRATDPEAYVRFAGNKRAPTTVKFGDATLLLDPTDQSKATVIGPEGYDTVDDVAGWVNQQVAEQKRAEDQAAQAVAASGEMFNKIGKVSTSISNIDSALNALNRGAETGYISQFFPSITAASQELENIRNQMGLDIVGAGSFGALSESELQFALDTALPTGLDGPELTDWLTRKKTAQEKLRYELIEAGMYLQTPGATIGELMKRKQSKWKSEDGTIREK